MKIKIDGEVLEVSKVLTYSDLPIIKADGKEFYLAKDSEAAGEAVRKRWDDMARDDPKEFVCLIGEERLVGWAIGQSDGFGISSFEEFLDRVSEVPEEELASWDGQEREVEEIEGLDDDEEAELEELQEKDIDLILLSERDRRLALEEMKSEYDEWQELIEELGFTPTVAYRCN